MKTIPLTQGYRAVIDDEDFALVSRYRWRVQKTASGVYARAWGPMVNCKREMIMMHRLIAKHSLGSGAISGLFVDHRDGDTLNNSRSNLRPADHSRNAMNKRRGGPGRRFKGMRVRAKGWSPVLKVSGRSKEFGTFPTEEMAAKEYDRLAKIHYGEFARLNFPEAA